MKKFLWLSLFLLGLLQGCVGIPVATDYAVGSDFSVIKTYAWLEPKQKIILDPYVDNDLMNKRLHDSIDRVMKTKGYKLSAKEQADVFISYHLSSYEKLKSTHYHSHFGYYPCYGCFSGAVGFDTGSDITQYREGSFIIDLVDPKSRQLLWRGVAERRLPKSGTPEKRDEYVNDIVAAILAKFPPK